MVFTVDSQIVKNYVLLIKNYETTGFTIDNVPNLFNLIEVVELALNNDR